MAERWSIVVEFDAEPDSETSAGERAAAASAAVLRTLTDDYDLWPTRIVTARVSGRAEQ